MTTGLWASLADHLDPPKPPAELVDPVSLADLCDEGYVVRAHLRVIGEEMRRLYYADGFDRLILNEPPQTGKSVSAVEWGAFWWLCLNPKANIVIGSYNDDLAVVRGRAVRRLVLKYGKEYGLTIEHGSASVHDWRLTSGGGVRSVGVGSGITGHPGDVIFIDDPIRSRADADSLVKRDAVYNWYSADLISRLSPGGRVVLVSTPWHVDDLRARVLEHEGDLKRGGRWRVVRMPAFADEADDPLGRAIGDPLPHPKLPDGDTEALQKHWEQVRATVILRDWMALWQCDPKPMEGTLLSWSMLRERRCWQGANSCSPSKVTAVAVDPSGGGRDTAGVIGGYLGEDNRLHIGHDRSGVMSSEGWSRAACELAAEIGADRIIFENNYGGDMALLAIRTAWEALRREHPERFSQFVPRIVTARARVNKLLRAEPIAQQWIEDRIVTSAYLPDLESEWATWQQGDKDSPGRIDASVYLAFSLLPIPTSGSSSMAGARKLASTNLLSFGSGAR